MAWDSGVAAAVASADSKSDTMAKSPLPSTVWPSLADSVAQLDAMDPDGEAAAPALVDGE